MRLFHGGVIGTGLVLFSFGCSSGKNSDAAGSVDWAAGRGGDVCRQWQQSYCELVGRCSATSVSTCAAQAQQITCKDESASGCSAGADASTCDVAACVTALESATCAGVPSGCDLPSVARTDVAVQGCKDFVAAACAYETRCGSSTPTASCITAREMTMNCTRAIGLGLKHDACLSEIAQLPCSASAKAESCTDDVLLH